MTNVKALRKLLIGIAAICSEVAGDLEEVSSNETTTTAPGKEDKKAKATKKTEEVKETKTTKATTGKGKAKPAKEEEDELEEVESPYTEDNSSDDPADFGDDEDDFAEMEEEKKEPTVEELRSALVKYAQANTKDKAYKVLEKFGAKKANEVKKTDLAKAIAALKVK